MEQHKLEKDLIFFIPGQPGVTFTYKTGNLINDDLIDQAKNILEYETEKENEWIMARRAAPRLS